MIDPEEFDQTLRKLVKAEPFVPFEVEMDDGRRIPIRQPNLAFGGGSAGFIDPDYEDGAIVDFSHQHVVGFHPMGQEVAT
jgi:hypothetical protein